MIRDFLSQAFSVLVVALVATAVALWPAHAWGAGDGVRALLQGAGICVLAALLGRIALVAIRQSDPGAEGSARALQVGMGVRLLATLALALPVLLARWAPPFQVAAWLGLHYAAQLVLEVFVSLKELGQNHGPSGSAERGTEPSTGRDAPAAAESARHTTEGDESA